LLLFTGKKMGLRVNGILWADTLGAGETGDARLWAELDAHRPHGLTHGTNQRRLDRIE
jgi:hypothetical protein